MSDQPAVSVVMPVRNGGAFLAAAVDSILAQSFTAFEFIIVDDGSEDGTPQRLAQHAQGDARIRVFNAPAGGIVAALNLGVGQAKGPLIARMDADDVALPGRLAAQVAFLEAYPELGAVGTAAERIDRSGRRIGLIRMPTTHQEILVELGSRSPIIHPSAMIRRAELLAAGSYRPCCILAEDYDLWLRLAARTRLGNLPEVWLQLRSHPGQLSETRRLAQRASAALARRLASDWPPPVMEGDGEQALWLTLSSYVRGLHGRGRQVQPGEWRDAVVILRALRAHGDLATWDALRIARRLPAPAGERAINMAKLVLGI